jgi:uncharacterized protein (DUF1330 family)
MDEKSLRLHAVVCRTFPTSPNSVYAVGRLITKKPTMTAYAIFDVEIHNPERYQDFMAQIKPALEAAGARYLSRGGAHKVYEGDWIPRRIVLLEFPSVAVFEEFYYGEIYQNLKSIRDESSSARLVSVEGL